MHIPGFYKMKIPNRKSKIKSIENQINRKSQIVNPKS